MRISLRLSAVFIIGLAAAAATACDDGGAGRAAFGGWSSPAEPTALGSASLTVQPEPLVAEVVPRADCRVLPAFRTSLIVSVRSGRFVFVRGLGFEFLDAFGRRRIPTIVPGSTTAASIPTSVPLPLPSSPPLVIPGTRASFPGVEANRTATFPFTLQFPCDVPSSGTIVVAVQTSDRNGSGELMRARVRVGR